MIAIVICTVLVAFVIYYVVGRASKNVIDTTTSKIVEDTQLKKKQVPEKVDKHEKLHIVHSKHLNKVNSNGTDHMDHKYFWKEVGGHTSAVTCLAFSANGALVGSCSTDGTIRCIAISDIGLVAPREIYTKVDLPN